ncbi:MULTISPECIES: hypothetical protein [Nonomuraea]|uniref:Uncharacterized protein n=1 Tax=Nonomuraea salmonea TaxID=46181 RepID=A0ABV5NTU3_9ACTN
MTGPGLTLRGFIAPRGGVMGLVLLSLLVATTFSVAWYGGGQVGLSGGSAGQVWLAGAYKDKLSSLPPQAGNAREHHTPSLWPPLRGTRNGEAGHLALLPSPAADGPAIRDPQQFGHRTAGSRSPPPA